MTKVRKHPGFTLVELLIVIVIIVILAALGITVSQKMLMKSRATLMASNMRQMAPVFRVYSTEHNDVMVPCKAEQVQPDNSTAEMIWHEVLLSLIYENTDPQKFKTVEWWEYNNSFLKNPMFRANDTPNGWEPLNPGYGYNLKMPENYAAIDTNSVTESDPEAIGVPIGSIDEPARTPLIAPCDQYFYRYDEAQIAEFKGGTLAKFLSDGRFPVLFMAGQVELVRPDEYITRRLHEMPLDPDSN